MKLSEIKGLLVEKKRVRYSNEFNVLGVDGIIRTVKRDIKYDPKEEGFNQAIDLMGEREITLDREKLAEDIRNHFGIIELTSDKFKDEFAKLTSEVVNYSMTYGLADAILSSLPEIIEVTDRTPKCQG